MPLDLAQRPDAETEPETEPDTPEPPPGDDPPARAEGPATGGAESLPTSNGQRMILYTVIAAAAGLVAAWLLGALLPGFLLHRTPPIQADAVVLFLGPDEAARQAQVDDLIDKGWAKYVIVPWEGRIIEARVSQALVTPPEAAAMAHGIKADLLRAYVERTHVEMIQARELMRHIEATRAIFVSSPYHMRRIAIMAGRFLPGEIYDIAYLPTVYDPPRRPWFANWRDVRWVVSEWGKIVWFVVYSPFV